MRIGLIAMALVVAMLCLGFGYQWASKRKQGFIYTNKVFEKFEGTIHLQRKLQAEHLVHQTYLDSLTTLIGNGRKELASLYVDRKDYFQAKEQEMNEMYTKDLWKYINDAIKDYGDENDFDLIFGASGDGALMYANQSFDKTDAVIEYINSMYRAGPAAKD